MSIWEARINEFERRARAVVMKFDPFLQNIRGVGMIHDLIDDHTTECRYRPGQEKKNPADQLYACFHIEKYCESPDGWAQRALGAGEGDGKIEPSAQYAFLCLHDSITNPNQVVQNRIPGRSHAIDTKDERCL